MDTFALEAGAAIAGLVGFALHGSTTLAEYAEGVSEAGETSVRHARRGGAALLYLCALLTCFALVRRLEPKTATAPATERTEAVEDHAEKQLKVLFFPPELTERERESLWWDFEAYVLQHPRIRAGGDSWTGDFWYELRGAENGL